MSVWVEIFIRSSSDIRLSSRSTWACELKFYSLSFFRSLQGHAPRERVSWNVNKHILFRQFFVTLHVSVWVEMVKMRIAHENGIVTLHVSVWVEIMTSSIVAYSAASRSTWACELKFALAKPCASAYQSRSTWACELKWQHSSVVAYDN